MALAPTLRIGTAGWALPRDVAEAFPGEGRHLERYARVLGCAEINSSFHRPHRVGVYQRWAASTPAEFRFAAKLPRTVTHDARLRDAGEPLRQFLAEVAGLGEKLAVLLVQLPPSLAFEASVVRAFVRDLAGACPAAIVCEPRHASWFTGEADAELVALRVGRVAADPARVPEAARPGGWLGPEGDGRGAVVYHRWHGSPRTYWSGYEPGWLRERALELSRWPADAERWCVFDNTAGGAAAGNALELQAMLRAAVDGHRPPRSAGTAAAVGAAV